jgi:hypothetical protein
LKAPKTKRLKPKIVELLSSFGFDFNLRRYNTAKHLEADEYHQMAGPQMKIDTLACLTE